MCGSKIEQCVACMTVTASCHELMQDGGADVQDHNISAQLARGNIHVPQMHRRKINGVTRRHTAFPPKRQASDHDVLFVSRRRPVLDGCAVSRSDAAVGFNAESLLSQMNAMLCP